MRAFVTGAAGFVGASLARQLIERGDSVIAAVRDPARAGVLAAIGCEVIGVDLASAEAPVLQDPMQGADVVFHLAGSYRVGIPRREQPPMYAANVVATGRVVEAAVAAGTPRIVYVSTANVFGNTSGFGLNGALAILANERVDAGAVRAACRSAASRDGASRRSQAWNSPAEQPGDRPDWRPIPAPMSGPIVGL